MAQAEIIEAADAVVAELNATTFSQAFTAVRKYVPTYELQEMDSLHVTVVPKRIEREAQDRASDAEEFMLDIGVQKRVGAANVDAATMDPLTYLCEEIADHFMRWSMASPEAACIAIEHNPIYLPSHLREMGQFTSVITLTFWRR